MAYPVAQVEDAVALDHLVGVLQEVLGVEGVEEAFAGAEYDGDDVHADLVDEARGEDLAADVAGGDLSDAVAYRAPRAAAEVTAPPGRAFSCPPGRDANTRKRPAFRGGAVPVRRPVVS